MLIITLGNGKSCATIIDIETGTGKKIKILFSAEAISIVSENNTPDNLKKIFFNQFKETLEKTLKSGISPKTIESVCVVLSSPWVISRNKTLSFSDSKSFVVKESLIEDLVKASKADIQSEILHESMICYEERILNTFLNGYETKMPLGKDAFSIHIAAIQNFIAQSTKDAIEEELEKFFNIKIISFHVSALCMLNAFSKIEIKEKNYLFLSIGDEITEISLIREGMLKDTVSIPKGKNFVIRTLGEKLHATLESSVSMMRLMSEKILEKKLAEKVKKELDAAGLEWLKDVHEGLKKIGDMVPLPTELFINTLSSESLFFSDFIMSDEYYRFNIKHIPKQDILNFFEINDKVSIEEFSMMEIMGVAMK